MRYSDNIPYEQLSSHASDGMLLFTSVLATLIGIVLAVLGRKGKVLWLFVWSIGLVLCSISMGLYLVLQV